MAEELSPQPGILYHHHHHHQHHHIIIIIKGHLSLGSFIVA